MGDKNKKHVRPTWDEYFMNIMEAVSKRVTCDRARAGGGGCVVIKDKRILVTGYVGSPPGCCHCDDIGHQFKETIHEDGKVTNHCVRTTHAEQNAICQAAKLGISLDGSTFYCFMAPCYVCAKLIITTGAKRVVAVKDYHAAQDSKNLFKEAGVEFELLNKEVQQYEKM
ncbi:MAG: cytidine/deoxycytidylate deaminase family protein [archaeon]